MTRKRGWAVVIAGAWTLSGGFAEGRAAGETVATYRATAPVGPGSVARLRARLGDARFADVLRINRVDLTHAMRADTLVVPDSGYGGLALSPFPRGLRAYDRVAPEKLLLVSVRVQAFGAYEGRDLLRWGPVCTGARSAPTDTGLFFANWKAREHVSSVDPGWNMPWTVNIEPDIGTALHQYSLPGRPSSHCCIRLLEEDARWIFEWVAARWPADGPTGPVRGTPVIVFGAYDFESPPPWRGLPSDPAAGRLSAEEVDAALELLSAPGPLSRAGASQEGANAK